MDGHALSVFTNRSVTAPLSAKRSCLKEHLEPSAITSSEVEHLLQTNIELQQEVQQCLEEYQSTLVNMQALRAARTDLCSVVHDHDHTGLVATTGCTSPRPSSECDSVKEGRICSSFANTERFPRKEGASLAVFCEADTACGTKDPFASPGMELIEQMWENFSVGSYKPDCQLDRVRPNITIPQPFAMTQRESREPRRKSRSMIIAEKERAEKAAQVEAEMKKQFRATPVPAHTFLPLYTLVRAKDETRRQVSSRRADINHMSLRHDETDKGRRPYSADCTHRMMFKAKPVPKTILDYDVTEQMKCEEEYRKVRIKVRAQNLLATSHLPFSTRSRLKQRTSPSQITLQGERI